MIGEYERAFYGNQYASMAPLLEHYGIQLWCRRQAAPSAGSEDDEQLVLALGLQSKREITRTRTRVRTRDGRPGTGLLPILGGACRVGGQYAMFAASSRACSDSEDRAAISAALRVAL